MVCWKVFLSVPTPPGTPGLPCAPAPRGGALSRLTPLCDGPSSLLLGTDCPGMGSGRSGSLLPWCRFTWTQISCPCTLRWDLVTLFPLQRGKTTKELGLDVL